MKLFAAAHVFKGTESVSPHQLMLICDPMDL